MFFSQKKRSELKAHYLWNINPKENQRLPDRYIKKNSKYFEPIVIDTFNQYRELILNYQPVAKIWEHLPHWIMKSDILRLLLVYQYGHFYFDVDFRVKKLWKWNRSQESTILFVETELKSVDQLGPRECKDAERKLRIANFAFGSEVKNNKFFREVIDECVSRVHTLLEEHQDEPPSVTDILWSTGPDVITSVYHIRKQNYKIYLVSSDSYQHDCFNSWKV